MIAVNHHIGSEKFFQQYLHVSTEQQKILELSPGRWLKRLALIIQQACMVLILEYRIPYIFPNLGKVFRMEGLVKDFD